MHLPSFIWLWRIAAWSMGFALLAYFLLGITGVWSVLSRRVVRSRPPWLVPLHFGLGISLVLLVWLLLLIGVVGTLGHYGHLGHSWHLPAGLAVVGLVMVSAWSATQIRAEHPWARRLHVSINTLLFLGLAAVSVSGWQVVQKYLN